MLNYNELKLLFSQFRTQKYRTLWRSMNTRCLGYEGQYVAENIYYKIAFSTFQNISLKFMKFYVNDVLITIIVPSIEYYYQCIINYIVYLIGKSVTNTLNISSLTLFHRPVCHTDIYQSTIKCHALFSFVSGKCTCNSAITEANFMHETLPCSSIWKTMALFVILQLRFSRVFSLLLMKYKWISNNEARVAL